MLERVLLRRAYGNELHQFLLTLGVGLIITEIVRIIAGPNFQAVRELEYLGGNVSVLGGSVQEYRLFLIALGVVVFVGMLYVLRRTRIGLIVPRRRREPEHGRGAGDEREAGFSIMFAAGRRSRCSRARTRRAYYGGAGPALGEEQIVLAFVIAVVGGLGSYVGLGHRCGERGAALLVCGLLLGARRVAGAGAADGAGAAAAPAGADPQAGVRV